MRIKATKNNEAEEIRRRLVEDECAMLAKHIKRLRDRQKSMKKALELYAERAGKGCH
jgi:cytochrome c553